MASAGTLFVSVKGDTSSLRKSLDKAKKKSASVATSIRKNLNKVATGFAKATSAAAVLAGAGGLILLNKTIKESIALANEQEQAEAKLEAVLKATGGAAGFNAQQLKDMASSLQQVTTIGDETIIGAQAILATFKKVGGEAFERTTKAALDMSAVMGTDLNSSMLQVGKAMNDPATGLSMLTRVGITFNETQKSMIKELQASGDMMGAQNIILKELETQFGGAASAVANTFGGAVIQTQNSLGDLKEEIGFTVTKNNFFIESTKLANQTIVGLIESVKLNRSALAEMAKSGVLRVADALILVIETMRFFENGWLGIKLVSSVAFEGLARGINATAEGLRAMLRPLDLIFEGLEKLGAVDANPFDTLVESSEMFIASSGDVRREVLSDIEETNAKYSSWNAKVKGIAESLRNVSTESTETAETVVINNKKVEESVTQLTKKQISNLEKNQKLWNDLTLASLPEHERAIERINRKYEEFNRQLTDLVLEGLVSMDRAQEIDLMFAARWEEELSAIDEKTKEKTEDVTTFWDEAMRDMQSSTKSLLTDAIKGNFDDIGSSFLAMIDDMVANWVAAQIQMSLWGNDSTGGGTGGGLIEKGIGLIGGLFSPAFNSVGSAATGNFGPMPGRAHGGQVFSGASYLVGERGPEIITMGPSGGDVIPNSEINKFSPETKQSFNINVTVPPDKVNAFNQTAGQIGKQIASQLQLSLARNG